MELGIYLFFALYSIGVGVSYYILKSASDNELGADPPYYWLIVLVLSLLFPITFIVLGVWEMVDRIKQWLTLG